MAKNVCEYLPLSWAKKITSSMGSLSSIPPELFRVALEQKSSDDEIQAAINSNQELGSLYDFLGKKPFMERQKILLDLDFYSVVMLWAKNKQVFKFDSDFLAEIANTSSTAMSENCWDYLPYDVFYIDFSDNSYICHHLLAKGMFVKIEKVCTDKISIENSKITSKTAYLVHSTLVSETANSVGVFPFINETIETKVDDIIIPRTSYANSESKERAESVDNRLYMVLLHQLLTYLSSTEPDICEDENTKRTYRKPKPNTAPKNKFSEIQQWDVGIRFGASFRKWRKAQEAAPSNTSNSSGERSKQRPHSRRAHWSHYWYGSGDNKERRPKWVSSYLVNVDTNNQDVTVIHNVDKGNKRE